MDYNGNTSSGDDGRSLANRTCTDANTVQCWRHADIIVTMLITSDTDGDTGNT